MTILRIERAVYAVDDLPTCSRFFEDFGLTPRAQTDEHAIFTTQTNQVVELRRCPAPNLPPAVEAGSTLRELVWGVNDSDSLDRLVADLRADRAVTVDADGTAHTLDETGFGLGLAVADREVPGIADTLVNRFGAVRRWNRPLAPPSRVRPLRICHVASTSPRRAGRRPSPSTRAPRLPPHRRRRAHGRLHAGDGRRRPAHLLLCHRPDRAGVNHISYEVPASTTSSRAATT